MPDLSPSPLAPPGLACHARILGAADPDLAALVLRIGLPTYPPRRQGFLTLLGLILEQQVSVASALAVRDRLLAHAEDVTPERFLLLDDALLRTFGFSRQKAGYCRSLAAAIVDGRFRPERLVDLPDEAAMAALTGLKGIGRWTAEVYLLFALGRPDVWPAGDLAVQVALGRLKGLPGRPDEATTRALAEGWRPYRSAAAVLLWHHYLTDRLMVRARTPRASLVQPETPSP